MADKEPDAYSEEMIKALGCAGENADKLRALRQSDELRLFFVDNTADRRQLILAANRKFARLISCMSGHIHTPENGKVLVPTDKYNDANAGFVSAVRRAMQDRTPGVIVQRGNHAIMGEKVYLPLHEV